MHSRIKEYLVDHQIDYQLVDEESEDFKDFKNCMVRSVLLEAEGDFYLATLPRTSMLDFDVLRKHENNELLVSSAEIRRSIFKSCDLNDLPSFSDAFDVQGIIDESLFVCDKLLLTTETKGKFVAIESEAIKQVFAESERVSFAFGENKLYSASNIDDEHSDAISQFTPLRIKQRVDETFDLPAMPDIAQDIMRLRVDPSADAKKLADIVARDPSLAAQIISWASSPYYGYQGTIDSIHTAISRVLGFDLVMNLALGISIGKSLNIADEGPLGVNNFWRQSVYCASLVEKLSLMIPVKQRPERGLAYLSGLLHNFGHLLMGHLFPPQFALINQYILANPNIRVEDIEHFVMGVTHQEIGAWLMQNWHMPDELIVAVRWHHHEEFWSQHATYSNLVLVANRLLQKIDVGDETLDELPQSTLELLHLDAEKVQEGFDAMLEDRTALDQMTKQLVA